MERPHHAAARHCRGQAGAAHRCPGQRVGNSLNLIGMLNPSAGNVCVNS
ncbi:chaplin [Streptomyces lunaelactis]|nr:chaplin [Streptomyces lunaelactis]